MAGGSMKVVVLCLIVFGVSSTAEDLESKVEGATTTVSGGISTDFEFSNNVRTTEATQVVTTIELDDGQVRMSKALDTDVTQLRTSNSTFSGTSLPKHTLSFALPKFHLTKCNDSEINYDFFNTPQWLRQPLTSKMEALRVERNSLWTAQEYYAGRIFSDVFEKFQCNSPVEFSLRKLDLEEQLQGLQKAKRSILSINELMEGFLLPNGYLKLKYSTGTGQINNVYYPPRSFCLSRFDDDLVQGLLCPMDDPDNHVPKIRKCAPLGFAMKYDAKKGPTNLDVLEVEQGWRPIIQYGELSGSDSVNVNEDTFDAIIWQERLPCNPVMYMTDPRVATSHRNARYKAIKLIEDGTVLTRAKAHVPWQPASEELGTSEYCIDGYMFPGDSENSSLSYFHRRDRQLILACRSPEAELRKPAFGSILVFASILLAVNVIIYGLVRPTENIHGWTSAVFVFCLFMYFVCLMIGNARGLQLGSSRCVSIGILQHYFHLSVFFWIAVMNFDIWHVLRHSKFGEDLEAEGFKRFALHCCVALVGPAIIVGVAVSIQNAYDLNQDHVILPLYGYESCALNNDSQFYYFLIPTLFVFAAGIAFGAMAIHEHYKLKQEAEKVRLENSKLAQARWHAVYLRTIAITKFASTNGKSVDDQVQHQFEA